MMAVYSACEMPPCYTRKGHGVAGLWPAAATSFHHHYHYHYYYTTLHYYWDGIIHRPLTLHTLSLYVCVSMARLGSLFVLNPDMIVLVAIVNPQALRVILNPWFSQ